MCRQGGQQAAQAVGVDGHAVGQVAAPLREQLLVRALMQCDKRGGESKSVSSAGVGVWDCGVKS